MKKEKLDLIMDDIDKALLPVGTKTEYTNKELINIGGNVASLWGGEYLSHSIDYKEKKVLFEAIENGEDFIVYLDFKDLNEYA